MGSGFEDVGGGDDKATEKPPVRKRSEARQPGLAKGTPQVVKFADGTKAFTNPGAMVEAPTVPAKKPESVKEVSAALEGELLFARVTELADLEQRAVENARATGKRLAFDVVQRKRDDSALRPDMARIVETIWVVDVHKAWEHLKKGLRLGVKRRNHAAVARALDDARQKAYEASCLFITCKRERERWELANAGVHSAMWNSANRVLQSEKDAKIRSKQITDADVQAMATTLFPDEWEAYQTKLKEIEWTCEAMASLATAWGRRAEDLQSLHGKMRG